MLLPGGDLDVAAELRAATTATGDAVIAERLVRAHGSRWRRVWAFVERDASLSARVTPERPYVLAELRYAVEEEMALTLGDLLIRRTPVAFETKDHGLAAARRIAELVRRWLGERADWGARALEDYELEVERMFSVLA
jgi:glycerol-3-phosphate dehydrogenase